MNENDVARLVTQFVVEGTWNSKMVHREVIEDATGTLFGKYSAIQCGTTLDVLTYPLGQPPTKPLYRSMLRDAVRSGKTGFLQVGKF